VRYDGRGKCKLCRNPYAEGEKAWIDRKRGKIKGIVNKNSGAKYNEKGL